MDVLEKYSIVFGTKERLIKTISFQSINDFPNILFKRYSISKNYQLLKMVLNFVIKKYIQLFYSIVLVKLHMGWKLDQKFNLDLDLILFVIKMEFFSLWKDAEH